MKVKKLDPNAIIPTKAYKSDAGYDLYSLHDYFLRPSVPTVVDTGIALEIPEGCFGQVCDRSSMGKKGIKVFGGIIDCGYTGEISVVLMNLTDKHGFLSIVKDQKIAQIIIQPYTKIDQLVEVDELSVTARNTAGFGSSGA